MRTFYIFFCKFHSIYNLFYLVKNLVLDYWRQFDNYVLDPVVNKVYDRTEWDESKINNKRDEFTKWVILVYKVCGISPQNK